MPRFMYSVFVSLVFLWSTVVYLIFKTAPNSYLSILSFLIILFLALSFTFSIPLFFYQKKVHPKFKNVKFLYRKGLKWSLFVSFGIVSFLFLKALDLINLLNFGLFLLLYTGILYQIKSKR